MLWQAYRHEPYGDVGPDTDKIAVLSVMDINTRKYAPLITGIGNARNGVLRRRG